MKADDWLTEYGLHKIVFQDIRFMSSLIAEEHVLQPTHPPFEAAATVVSPMGIKVRIGTNV